MASVLIIYGRDQSAREVLSSLLEKMGHTVREFSHSKLDTPSRPFNPEIIENLFIGVNVAVVALSPDEESMLRYSLRSESEDWKIHQRVRPNVLIEHGMAVGKLGSKVVEVSFQFPFYEIPSDWSGLNPIPWSGSFQTYRDIKQRFLIFGIVSKELTSEDVAEITYLPPEPSFLDASPPYEFIVEPFRLRIVMRDSVPLSEAQAYEDAGFERSHKYLSQQTNWYADRWRPYIHKDEALREYVWPGVQLMPGETNLNMFLVRKRI